MSYTYGWENVIIDSNYCTSNGYAGISVDGSWLLPYNVTAYKVNKNIKITNCTASGNLGNRGDGFVTLVTGSGIFLGGSVDSKIDSCVAYSNGGLNRRSDAGPIGLWMAECNRSKIRNSLSFTNSALLTSKDGGGYDMDGGCTNCVIENCVSENNDGAGYGLYDWGGTNPLYNDTIRNCRSINDGINGYAGVSIWGDDANHKPYNCVVEWNFFDRRKSGPVINSIYPYQQNNIIFRNNCFYITNGATAKQSPWKTGMVWSTGNQLASVETGCAPNDPVISAARIIKKDQSITFVPNPVKSIVTVSLKGYDGDVFFRVTSIDGKIVNEKNIYMVRDVDAQTTLDFSDKQDGTYFVSTIDKNGKYKTESLVILH
jgi:hypothetical protein